MSTKTPLHVLVIGAGFGGLTLAHGLRKAGVSVAVYEKQRSRTDGLYGYRVGIDPTGNRALKDCLPPKLFETFLATCARTPLYFNVLTEKKRRTAAVPLRGDADLINSERSVSRQTLRQVLLTGLEDVTHFDKELTHYEQRADGTVVAYFADGSSATGDVLVAADGAHSAVRKQYLPHAKLKPAGITTIGAKVPMSPEALRLLPVTSQKGLSLVFAPKGFMCIWHVMEFRWDERGGIKDSAAGNDAELLRAWPGMLFDNTRDYISWGIWASDDKFPKDVLKLRGQALIDLVLKLTPNWHPDFRKLFAMADPTTPFPLHIATSEPVPAWQTTNVTLLGDAIHTMTPGQGVGANTSLRDAMLLTRALTSVHNGSRDLLGAIGEYEAEMIPYGFARVKDSLAENGTNGNDPLHKPVLGRAVLAGSRAYFKAVDKIPSVQRKFLDDLYTYRGAE
ncbi:FAD-dependent oxidoreductase [Kitasatospora kifunensis]|uniref:2-polyprenyl-6-methoxyphenol hydroxylase-like FAD-dependent oxidoreductase n=1 Tax=Kitasatospora kifunensis TaxID=58351 RepID=A0A7W7R3W9_KITKI|nr:NAD(P)/FAD-dependent oxidoreductase [Kitasatospora kifunensis]MBB4924906.1 2-polyprenyl-6-methoxyphenol hydroxylase-like FAD-dependent oxidoreductase [Kitasatospora kifunensis]